MSNEIEKRRRHSEVFDFPWCIYCGGRTLATTVDHVPARILFNGRIRPKGLEFPSCSACNDGTRLSEQVAAVICRSYPDDNTESAQLELRGLLTALRNNAPEILLEMHTPRAQAKFTAQRLGRPDGGFLKLDGPSVSAHLEIFAAKLAFALHYFKTRKPIPHGGGTVTLMYSNVSLLEGHTPDEIIAHVGEPMTLQQGAKHVGDQFRYNVAMSDNGTMSMGFASFREALAFATFGADEVSKLLVDGRMPGQLFRPGDLQKPVPPPEFSSIGIRYTFKPPW
jgi:hypothetical protein